MFFGVVVASFLMPIWIFFAIAFLYAFWRSAYELIALGFVVDVVFSPLSSVLDFEYTLLMGTLVFVAEFIKPYITYYDRTA